MILKALNNLFPQLEGTFRPDTKYKVFFFSMMTFGLALVFILAALYTMSAESIYKIGALFSLVGMALHAVVPVSRVLVILPILMFSLGEHMQLGMRNTLSLEYSTEGHGGAALGIQNAVHQMGTLAGYLIQKIS